MDTTAGSMALASSRPKKNADVIRRLIDAGAIIIAKANLSEFAYYKTAKAPAGWSPAGGQTQSAYVRGGFLPDDTGAGHSNPGGSSSGSAVGIAAGYAPISIGTETNGSIILPANRAALYALKPTIGIVSTSGIVPISKLCDSPGPMTKCARDLAILMDVLVDAAKTKIPEGGYIAAITGKWDGLRVGTLDPASWKVSEKIRKPVLAAEEQMMLETHKAYTTIQGLADTYHENVNLIPPGRFTVDGKGLLGQIFEATFQEELEEYLGDLEFSKVRTLGELIQFNKDHTDVELPPDYPDQEFLESALNKAIPETQLQGLIKQVHNLGRVEGLDKVFRDYNINILIGPAESGMTTFAAAAGYPIASLPLGYLTLNGRPHGLAAIAGPHREADLIQLMSAWEISFPGRQPPSLPADYAKPLKSL